MQKISILGCGWLGLPLGKQLTKNFKVLGSVRKKSDLVELDKLNITPFLIPFEKENNSIDSLFLNSDVLIITIPPKAENFVKTIKNLIFEIEKSTIKKVLYCSSISVYGNQNGILTENNTTLPKTENAKKMATVEQLLLQNSHFKTTVLRLGGLIGQQRHPAKHLSDKILKQPNALINLIHLTDCIGAIETIITQQLTGVFNLVAPFHPKKIVYYSSACQQLQIPVPKADVSISTNTTIISSEKINTFYHFKNEKLRL